MLRSRSPNVRNATVPNLAVITCSLFSIYSACNEFGKRFTALLFQFSNIDRFSQTNKNLKIMLCLTSCSFEYLLKSMYLLDFGLETATIAN